MKKIKNSKQSNIHCIENWCYMKMKKKKNPYKIITLLTYGFLNLPSQFIFNSLTAKTIVANFSFLAESRLPPQIPADNFRFISF